MTVDKMIKLCLLIFVSTVAYVYAAVAIYPYKPKPAEFADQKGCYIEDLNRVLPYNEPYYPKKDGSCLQYTCHDNNETQLVSCGALGFSNNCHLEHDYTLDYPKCCGTLVCEPTTPTPTTPTLTTPTPTPTTPTPTTTEPTCVTVTQPPCQCTRPQKPKGKKYTLPVEKPADY